MHRPHIRLIPFAVALWLVAVVSGLRALWAYSLAPGQEARAPQAWPAATSIRRDSGRPSLVVFIHPRCPCSRATLGELALLMARVGDRADAQVVFLQPSGVNDDWVQTDLWHRAIGIPGVSVRSDHDGVEARRFGVATSGEALLYDRAGRLIFAGGITAARGHSGDNEGRAALVDLLTDHSATHAGTPVFGCPLFDSAAHCTKEGAVQCRRS